MHLNFFRHVPLQVFASSLRSKPLVCRVDQLLAALTTTNTKDRRLRASGASSGHAQHAERMRCKHIQVILRERVMAKRNIRYPHTIGFRVTDETWFRIAHEVAETDLTPHDWCRMGCWIGSITSTDSRRKSGFYFSKQFALNSLLHTVFRCSRMAI
jgi:hypothetical protein